MEQTVHVFKSSRHYHNWIVANCAKCKKETGFGFSCPLAMAALKSLYAEGTLSSSIAEKIGFFDKDETTKSKESPLWKCREFVPK